MTKIRLTARPPAVAGTFYPQEATELLNTVDKLLDQAPSPSTSKPAPKAIIAPHAGYIYSGPIAASVYSRLRSHSNNIKRVVLFGPAHRLAFNGLSIPSNDAFSTPLGDIPLNTDAIEQLLELDSSECPIQYLDQAHEQEHSLEVHLPFLQRTLADFTLIPVLVGNASGSAVAAALDSLWHDDNTLIVISTDLSHFHDYATAQRMDQNTSQAIEALQGEQISYEDACGRNPVKGLLQLAQQRGLVAETIDLRNSGDTAGDKARVVGYGAYVFH